MPRRRTFDPGDDDWDYDDELPTEAPELTVYPDEDDPEPVLYLPDGTPLYRYRPPFGFNRD
jgi:hypothetical protein